MASGSEFVPTSGSNRGSFNMSGTMSESTSRDGSPTRSAAFVRRQLSPYPVAPPSMIITPCRTPMRAESVDRSEDWTALDQADMEQLRSMPENFSSTNMEWISSRKVLANEHQVCPSEPVTMFDTGHLANAQPMNRGPLSNAQSNCELGSFGRLTEVYRSLIGRRRNKEAKLEGFESKRSASVSPRTARQKFFEEYPFEPVKQSRDRSQMAAGGHFDTDELQSGFLIGSISSESVDMRKRSKDPLTGKKLMKNATGKDKGTSANRHLLDRFSSTLPFFKKKKSSYLEISLCEDTTPNNEPLYPSESMTSHFESSDYSIRQMEADSSVFKSNSLKRSGNCQIPVAASRSSSGRRADHVICPVPQ